MKSSLIVLSLVLVLVLVRADHHKDHEPKCEGRITEENLPKVQGNWVAVWGVSDGPKGQALIPKVTSSHLKLVLLDNKTLNYQESNFYKGETWNCSFFVMNATVVDGSDHHNLTLKVHEGRTEYEGKLEPFNDNVTLSFYQRCDHCLAMTFNSDEWNNFFIIYWREGHHTDVEEIKKEHAEFHKQAECLGFPTEPAFHYNGTADFCHKEN
ncbi:saxitoxin and tetrodotoxin-binding protein 1-like [Periophthalmus magnuspinnatus]|uniref:saxitoxin and tetrodotoxin-binding protein 1-like n=1 Tax=Periophthalmus magnuspinnatus TaxID=409849 RepID=UPI0024373054|nr:saxitoxin and tetrodotoxin-binding protein 1-like [Periophthalmus magnuspinnatus]